MLAFTVGVEENIQEVVGHITEGVCRPLKVWDLAFLCALNILKQNLFFLRTFLQCIVIVPWLRLDSQL